MPSPAASLPQDSYRSILVGGVYSLLSSALLILYEWVFHVSKLSFMHRSSFAEALSILLCALVVPSVFSLVLTGILLTLGALPFTIRLHRVWAAISIFCSTLILATFLFIVIDGFLYTLFDLGVLSLRSASRHLFALLYLALVFFIGCALRSSLARGRQALSNRAGLAGAALIILVSITASALRFYPLGRLQPNNYQFVLSNISNLPDIYLIGADGADADHFSIYGYKRNTTPFLSSLAKSSLVFLNAFADTNSSTGSLTTMLTGKSSLRTRVLHYPDILMGNDAHQHLPGVLRELGYRSIELGLRRYADSFDVNMRRGFDEVNYRNLNRFPLSLACAFPQICSSLELYLLIELEEKITSRIKHAFGFEKITNVYKFILEPHVFFDHDIRLTRTLQDFVAGSPAPVFAHVHFVGTHGPSFIIQERNFSDGKLQSESTYADFYDDALGSVDRNIEKLFEFLSSKGRLQNSLFVFYSDHDSKHEINVRIPLLLYAPGRTLTGRISRNVSLLDIAPTILDYLGLPRADWFEGVSLLKLDQKQRSIITAKAKNPGDKNYSSPPFFNFEQLGLIACNQSFKLTLASGELTEHTFSSSPEECSTHELLTNELARKKLLETFDNRGRLAQLESRSETVQAMPR